MSEYESTCKKCIGCNSFIIGMSYITVDEEYYHPQCFEIEQFKILQNIDSQLSTHGKALLHIVKALPVLIDNIKLTPVGIEQLGKLNLNIEKLTTSLSEAKAVRTKKTS